jgi:D-sedoheptulose 7-phosphate isomerase
MRTRDGLQEIENYFQTSLKYLQQFMTTENCSAVYSISKTLAQALKSGHKIISAGNGGSLADASHFAEELTGKFRKDRPALPAICINDPGHITCVANDYGYEFIFSRYLEAHGKKGDVFIGFTTSGNSQNIVEALAVAKKKKMISIVLTGRQGGKILKEGLADYFIKVPSCDAGTAQEIHIKIVHCLIMMIEKHLKL